MMKSMTLIPAQFTPAFGMPACGHAPRKGGFSAIQAAAATPSARVLSQGHVANFAGTRDYVARLGSSWRPSHC